MIIPSAKAKYNAEEVASAFRPLVAKLDFSKYEEGTFELEERPFLCVTALVVVGRTTGDGKSLPVTREYQYEDKQWRPKVFNVIVK